MADFDVSMTVRFVVEGARDAAEAKLIVDEWIDCKRGRFEGCDYTTEKISRDLVLELIGRSRFKVTPKKESE